MVFNNLFTPKNKKTSLELFLAVEIHESMIKSAVWQVEDEKPSIAALGSYELWDTEDSLLNGVDASLTEATRGLTAKPDRVILGLPDSWLQQNRIHPTKQKLIKRLISELDLKAIGMVTITEAIVSHLKTQEGVPPTAILLEIYPSKVIVSLVNLGEIQAQEEVGRSDDLARDVEEGLARFEAEKLPARFILTNGSDLENEEQQIVGYPWPEKLPFIHLPKVQVLPIDFSIRAIALSGGTEAAKAIGLEIVTDNPEQTPAENKSDAVVESITSDLTSIGFSFDGETSDMTEVTEVEEQEIITQPNFVEEPPEETPKTKSNLFSKFPHFGLPQLKLPRLGFPQFHLGLLTLIIPIVLFFLALGGVVAFYFLFGKVNVVMSIAPVRATQTIDLSIGTGSKDGFLPIIATKKTISAKASDSISTTGEAVVGDKATGKVTVYITKAVSLPSGSHLTAPSGQTFTLDSAVSASPSGDASSPSTTVSANITSTKIGADSNLDSGTKLTFDGHNKLDVIAVADSAFTGGSSRTVKAVSKADQDKLLAQVSDKIKSSIDDQLKAQDPDSRSLIIGTLKFTTKNYDHNINQEANTLSLDLAADTDVLVYSQKQMQDEIEKKILSSSDPGLDIDSAQTQISLSDPVPIDANTFTSKATVQASLYPKINEAQITNSVKGKPVSAIKTILQTIPGYKSALVKISPEVPLLDHFLPLKSANYSYTITNN